MLVVGDRRGPAGVGHARRRAHGGGVPRRPPTAELLRGLARLALAHRPPTGFLRDIVVEHSGEHARPARPEARRPAPDRRPRPVRGPRGGRHVRDDPRQAAGGREHGHPADGRRADARVGLRPDLRARLAHQVEQLRAGWPPDDHLDPAALDRLTRTYLRDAFRAISKVQRRIASDLDLRHAMRWPAAADPTAAQPAPRSDTGGRQSTSGCRGGRRRSRSSTSRRPASTPAGTRSSRGPWSRSTRAGSRPARCATGWRARGGCPRRARSSSTASCPPTWSRHRRRRPRSTSCWRPCGPRGRGTRGVVRARVPVPRGGPPRRPLALADDRHERGRAGSGCSSATATCRAAISLRTLSRALGLPAHRPHHALGDALTTAQAFLAIATHLDALSPQTAGSLVQAGERVANIARVQPPGAFLARTGRMPMRPRRGKSRGSRSADRRRTSCRRWRPACGRRSTTHRGRCPQAPSRRRRSSLPRSGVVYVQLRPTLPGGSL